MKVYKFGGASVNSSDGIRNVLKIIDLCEDKLMIIISAMGKMTNAFEVLLKKYLSKSEYFDEFDLIYRFHFDLIDELFEKNSEIFEKIENIFKKLEEKLSLPFSDNFDKEYDEIISIGEIISTNIVSEFLNENNVKNKWLDARKLIKTDSNFRSAKVDFEQTSINIKSAINSNSDKIFITQGFIASDSKNRTTTLGREGSDYSAAIFANILESDELTLWKDVEGIFNADPNLLDDVIKFNKISFREATELAYFGAKIIHSKTAKPLMNKGIKLIVRSFVDNEKEGTTVADFKQKISPLVPILIFKNKQILLTISSKEFEFINEYIFEKIFSILNKFNVKINLMQNSALNLSLCFDYTPNNFDSFLKSIEENFNYKYNKNLTLITIRHYNEETIQKITKDKNIKLEQKNNLNAFYLVEE